MNKYNYRGFIAGISTFLTVFGYWAKITHQAYADKALTIGMWALALNAAVFVYFKFVALKNKINYLSIKNLSVLFFCFFICINSYAQEIVNIVLVGSNGITENIKEANFFIVVKKYPNSFQRLDYNIAAPLQKIRNYSDSNLTVLEGRYCEYGISGLLIKGGKYKNNLKEDSWYYYNDTGKVILEEKFEAGILIETINPDTVKKKEKLPDTLTKVEIEATFNHGDKDWIKYLSKNLNADVGNKSVRGGKVIVQFVVNTSGKCVDIFLQKSVEFILDQEAIRVIENSPLWQPAVQEGRKVNAYRRQPITFAKE